MVIGCLIFYPIDLTYNHFFIESTMNTNYSRNDLKVIIESMIKSGLKGQVQLDFSGKADKIKVRFKNIAIEDIAKIKIDSEIIKKN